MQKRKTRNAKSRGAKPETAPERPVLYPYQQRWLVDTSRLKAGMFARQTGKTFTATLEIVRDCIDAEDAERSGRRKIGAARWVILSRGERQAREAMEEGVKRHLQTLQRAHEYAESNDLGATEAKVLEVRLPGGSRVTALPANPDTARGFSANVLLDEFAFHADSRKIWAALFPVISAGKKLWVVSTPNGKANKFHELMTGPEDLAAGGAEKRNPWSRHVVDIHQAVAEGLPRDVGLLRLGLGDPDAWAQEYELEWLDAASAWLPYDLLAGVEHERAGDPQGFTGGPAFIGNDIAVRTDLHSLRRVTTPAGNVRFDVHGGQGGGHGEKSHADRAWAAALGLYAADVPVEVFDYRPVPKRYNPDFDRDPHWVRVTGGFVRGVL